MLKYEAFQFDLLIFSFNGYPKSIYDILDLMNMNNINFAIIQRIFFEKIINNYNIINLNIFLFNWQKV